MKIPGHVAIIMDGNGRWARERKLPNIMGHRAGVKTVSVITEECSRLGVKALTLYAFSTENWLRGEDEVSALMTLLSSSLRKESKKIYDNGIRFNVIGDVESLPGNLSREIKEVIKNSISNKGMILTLAINYGSRQEIIYALKKACREVLLKKIDIDSITHEYFSSLLYTGDLQDPDLLIRTSGEMRISNFLLWQSAYAEFYFSDKLWPDFSVEELKKSFLEYEKRERRFGK